jgi:hypothetical protein
MTSDPTSPDFGPVPEADTSLAVTERIKHTSSDQKKGPPTSGDDELDANDSSCFSLLSLDSILSYQQSVCGIVDADINQSEDNETVKETKTVGVISCQKQFCDAMRDDVRRAAAIPRTSADRRHFACNDSISLLDISSDSSAFSGLNITPDASTEHDGPMKP